MRVVFRCDPALVGHLPDLHAPTLPDWLCYMPQTTASDLHPAPMPTVKQCPPFIDALTHGFVIPLACDVHVRGGMLS